MNNSYINVTGKPAKLYETTDPEWVPTLHMGHKVSIPDQERHKRAEKRAKRKRVASDSGDVGNASSEVAAAVVRETKNNGNQTDDAFMLEYLQLQRDNDRLRKENDELKMKILHLEKTHISSEHLQRSDHLLKFYTGSQHILP